MTRWRRGEGPGGGRLCNGGRRELECTHRLRFLSVPEKPPSYAEGLSPAANVSLKEINQESPLMREMTK